VAALPPLILRYSARSRSQLLAIHEYIVTQGNFTAAARVADGIREAAELLRYFPAAGRPGRVPRTREWVVRDWPYVIVYEIAGDDRTLTVLGIFHCRQSHE